MTDHDRCLIDGWNDERWMIGKAVERIRHRPLHMDETGIVKAGRM